MLCIGFSSMAAPAYERVAEKPLRTPSTSVTSPDGIVRCVVPSCLPALQNQNYVGVCPAAAAN
jgi:hypothetical protein